MTILRDDTDSRIEQLVLELLKNERAKVVVMFANEDNAKRVLKALLKVNTTSDLTFLASDSWGAKIHPVKGQETAAEGAVTLLPKRHVIKGECVQEKYKKKIKKLPPPQKNKKQQHKKDKKTLQNKTKAQNKQKLKNRDSKTFFKYYLQ